MSKCTFIINSKRCVSNFLTFRKPLRINFDLPTQTDCVRREAEEVILQCHKGNKAPNQPFLETNDLFTMY